MPTNFSIASAADLNAAIQQINVGGAFAAVNGSYIFNFTTANADLKLTSALTSINLAAGATLTINGNGDQLDGQTAVRGLVLAAGAVTINNLTLENMSLVGANGVGGVRGAGAPIDQSNGYDGGGGGNGGGAALGAALMVLSGASATLSNVGFVGNYAQGGMGGAAGPSGSGSQGPSQRAFRKTPRHAWRRLRSATS
jgi:hypothetical protein